MSKGNPFNKWYLALAGLGVGVRLLFLLPAGDLEPYRDESAYLYLAVCWNYFGFYSDMGNWLWPPGYPFFLATLLDWFGTGGIFAAKLIQVLGSGVIGLFLMLIARRTLDHRAAIVAGLIWCFYLPLIGFSHYLWPETIFLVCFVPALYLLVSWWLSEASKDSSAMPQLLGAGLLLGLSLLIKESLLYLSVVLVILMIWRYRRVAWGEGVRCATLFVLAQTAVVLPWTLRNYEVYDRFAPVAASLGQNCFKGIFGRYANIDFPDALLGADELGQAPPAEPDAEPLYARVYGRDHWIYRWFIHRPPQAVWGRTRRKDSPDALVVMNTVDQSHANVRKAIEFIRQYPRYFALLRVKRLSNWASPTSFFVRHNALGRYDGILASVGVRRALLIGALALPMTVLISAIPGLIWSLRRSPGATMLRCTALYALIPALLVGMSRHRAAVEPLLIIAAAGFLSRIGRPNGVSKLAAAGTVIAWAALGFLWLLAGRELLVIAGAIWG